MRPLSDSEILTSLTAVLKGTAKDWWRAEKRNINSQRPFKGIFYEDYMKTMKMQLQENCLRENKQLRKASVILPSSVEHYV